MYKFTGQCIALRLNKKNEQQSTDRGHAPIYYPFIFSFSKIILIKSKRQRLHFYMYACHIIRHQALDIESLTSKILNNLNENFISVKGVIH